MRELDFADYNEKLAKSGRDALAQSIAEARQRDQSYLGAEHLYLACSKVAAATFNETLHDLGLDPKEIYDEVSAHLDSPTNQYVGRGLKITFSLKSMFRLGWINCSHSGRSKIEAFDLLLAIFPEGKNVPVDIVRRRGIEPEDLVKAFASKLGVPLLAPTPARRPWWKFW